MRKKVFILAILWLLSLIARSQQPAPMKAKLTETTVVKDSTGKIYAYEEWQKLLHSGRYGLKPLNPDDSTTVFVVVHLTDEQRWQMLEGASKPSQSAYFKTGQTISNFKATDINGAKINLKDLKGKVVVINFWFINCPPCRQEIPELNDMVSEYKDSTGIVFLGIALDGKSDLKYFLKNTPFNYTIVNDGHYISEMYGIRTYPTHVVLDKEGKVFFHTSGYSVVTAHWLRKAIDELLAGK